MLKIRSSAFANFARFVFHYVFNDRAGLEDSLVQVGNTDFLKLWNCWKKRDHLGKCSQYCRDKTAIEIGKTGRAPGLLIRLAILGHSLRITPRSFGKGGEICGFRLRDEAALR
jgi:hypothetical protein